MKSIRRMLFLVPALLTATACSAPKEVKSAAEAESVRPSVHFDAAPAAESAPPPSATPPSATEPAESAPVAAKTAQFMAAPMQDEDRGWPDSCSGSKRVCLPPQGFVTRLCAGKYPGAAMVMFASGSPWQRAYVRVRQLDSVNTLGGPSGKDKLTLDEEVILLRGGEARKKEQMVVSGSDGLHVLRWDGTCATVMADEVTVTKPPVARQAALSWNYLDDNIQEALLKDLAIKTARTRQREVCKDSWMQTQELACQMAKARLSELVARTVRRGIALPIPDHAP
jgi:hypothetical protein